MPAMVIERQEKKAEPRTTATATPSGRSGFQVIATPSSAAMTTTTTAWISALTPAAKALPVMSAERGVGVTAVWVRCRSSAPR